MTLKFANSLAKQLRWRELSVDARALLEGKLQDLYAYTEDESAFDALGIDKQQSLLIFARRFTELKLWSAVRLVRNVYGEGGVGLSFAARPEIESVLRQRKDFTSKFAAHKDSSGGFYERGRSRASLHLLYVDDDQGRSWSAHFDLYSPLAFPHGTWLHWRREKVRGETPDWRAVKQALWNEDIA